jgi:uncharacterized protein (DUF427 family)
MSKEDHPIRIETNPNRIHVRLGDRVIADSQRALNLFEAAYPGVRYIPRQDMDMTLLTLTQHKTLCPYKGEASYFTVKTGAHTADNGVWTYETPKPVAARIAGYLAFDEKRFDLLELPAT